jgi:uncharacterized protein YjeT (DUF2065 family)
MSDLKILAVVMGGVVGLASGMCLLDPRRAADWIRDFPRSKFTAWILTAICVTWAAWLLFKTPLGRFDSYKPSLYVLAPLLFMLIVNYMDELLAARALGGLFILVPGPIIDIARQRGLLLVTMAYVLVVAGVLLLLSPYLFRKSMAYWTESSGRCKALGYIGLGIGVFIILFGLVFY